ncbi:MAG: hypothetical protein Q9172_004793 [Xanthocarpia lactea]
MTVSPPTPPSTAPTSPIHPPTSDGDFVINVGSDPEKDGYNPADSDPSRTSTVANGDIAKETFNQKLKQCCLPASLLTAKLPHIPRPWRKEDGRIKHIACIDDHPKGYPKLAAFMNSSENFAMCRRFAFLHTRVLLHRQDELAEMEKTLIAMDDEDQDIDPLSLESRRRDDDRVEQPSRKSLMAKIDDKLKDYDRDYGSLYKWIDDEKPLCREETKFIQFILSSSEERKKTDDKYVQLYSKYRVDVLARLILTVVAVVLLMVPTAVLFLVEDHGLLKIMLIMIFTMLFSAALSVFTKAKRHEMFAATAA